MQGNLPYCHYLPFEKDHLATFALFAKVPCLNLRTRTNIDIHNPSVPGPPRVSNVCWTHCAALHSWQVLPSGHVSMHQSCISMHQLVL